VAEYRLTPAAERDLEAMGRSARINAGLLAIFFAEKLDLLVLLD
jgi:hypothetical protein